MAGIDVAKPPELSEEQRKAQKAFRTTMQNWFAGAQTPAEKIAEREMGHSGIYTNDQLDIPRLPHTIPRRILPIK